MRKRIRTYTGLATGRTYYIVQNKYWLWPFWFDTYTLHPTLDSAIAAATALKSKVVWEEPKHGKTK